MARLWIRLFFSVCLLNICLHSPTFAQTGTSKSGTATVSGRVTVKGEPARGVAVSIQTQQYMASRKPTALQTKTDADGRYHFTGIPTGNYSVTAIAPSYTASSGAGFGARNKVVTVSDVENVEDIVIDLKPGGVITGRVTDAQGGPLTDQRVNLLTVNKDGARQQYYDNTNYDMFNIDDRGVYRIYGLPEGRYVVSVGLSTKSYVFSLQGSRTYYPRTFHPNTVDESKAKVIEVTEGSEVTGIDISVADLKKTYDIFGRVVNADTGQPVPGIALSYGLLAERGQGLMVQGSNGERSDANGQFQLSSVLPGKYAIFTRPEIDSDFYAEPTICDIGQSDVHGLEVKVRQGASISGFVVIDGPNDPALAAKLSQVLLYARATSDQYGVSGKSSIKVYANGGFQARGLPPGNVDLLLQTNPSLGLSKLRLESNGAPQPYGIELRAGQHLSDVRLVVGYSAGVLRGQVKIVGGVLPEEILVSVSAYPINQPGSIPAAQADARGQFRFENLTPGEYELRPFVYTRQYGAQQIGQISRLFSTVKERVIVSNNNEAQVMLVVDLSQKGGSIRGQLKVEGGVIPADFVLIVFAKRIDDSAPMERAQVDAQGQFRIENLAPGEYELQLSVSSRAPADRRVPQLAPSIVRVKERVVVSNGAEAQAALVVNLSR